MSEPHSAHLIIVTGLSGAGRSTAAHALEDGGWRVIDNLPSQLLPSLVDLATPSESTLNRLAVVVDVRGGSSVEEIEPLIAGIREKVDLRVLFLDATDTDLVKRYEASRRPHPLQGKGTILDGIKLERDRLGKLRELADVVLDTTGLNPNQTATLVHESFRSETPATINVVVESFGFKHGIPVDADLMADVRFLPNPFWSEHLRHETGLNPEVQAFVLGHPDVEQYLGGFVHMIEPTLKGYVREHKRYATIAIGCTGGKHRSVAISEELARRIGTIPGVSVTLKHRDIGRE
ncbi:MAG: hypothetical protein RJA31_1027 [Actinomycetota bacterium]|jgi:RNase adapter protein RapZ